MKSEDFSSITNPFQAPELPDDFARNVIVKARAVQRHRQIAGRIVAGMTVMLLAFAIPLANRISSRNGNLHYSTANLAARDPAVVRDLVAWGHPVPHVVVRNSVARDTLASYRQGDNDETDAAGLAEAVNPDAVSDYLMPNTSALTQFAATYSDASWDYDSDWTENSDDSAGG
ncbi:MAG: hypothetical protein ACLQBA_24860 [Candidatus Binataceae bacterium]